MPDSAIPRLPDGLGWKLLIGRFQFLEADDVVVGCREPLEQHGKTATPCTP